MIYINKSLRLFNYGIYTMIYINKSLRLFMNRRKRGRQFHILIFLRVQSFKIFVVSANATPRHFGQLHRRGWSAGAPSQPRGAGFRRAASARRLGATFEPTRRSSRFTRRRSRPGSAESAARPPQLQLQPRVCTTPDPPRS